MRQGDQLSHFLPSPYTLHRTPLLAPYTFSYTVHLYTRREILTDRSKLSLASHDAFTLRLTILYGVGFFFFFNLHRTLLGRTRRKIDTISVVACIVHFLRDFEKTARNFSSPSKGHRCVAGWWCELKCLSENRRNASQQPWVTGLILTTHCQKLANFELPGAGVEPAKLLAGPSEGSETMLACCLGKRIGDGLFV